MFIVPLSLSTQEYKCVLVNFQGKPDEMLLQFKWGGGGEGEGEALLGVNDTDFNVWLTITFWKEQLFLLFSPIYNFVLFLGLQ